MNRAIFILILLAIGATLARAAKMPPQPERFKVTFYGTHRVTTNSLWSQAEVSRTRKADTNFAARYAQKRVTGTNDGNPVARQWLVVDRFTRKVVPRTKITPLLTIIIDGRTTLAVVNPTNRLNVPPRPPGAKAMKLPTKALNIAPIAPRLSTLRWTFGLPGAAVEVQSSPNLRDWATLTTTTNGYVDVPTSQPKQFFRAVRSGVTLLWDANPPSENVAGYRVYHGMLSRVYMTVFDVGNVTTCRITNLYATNYFAVTAYDSNGLESAFSQEVSYVRASGLSQSLRVAVPSLAASPPWPRGFPPAPPLTFAKPGPVTRGTLGNPVFLKPGDVVRVSEDDWNLREVISTATPENPAFIIGRNKQRIGQLAFRDYSGGNVIVDNLDVTVLVNPGVGATISNIVVRNCQWTNQPGGSDGHGFCIGSLPGQGFTRNVVLLSNRFDNIGDWRSPVENDLCGIYIVGQCSNVFLIGNDISHCAGDAIAGGANAANTAHHIYEGFNRLWECRENGIDHKAISHIYISENSIWGMYPPKAPGQSANGEAIVLHEQWKTNVWVTFNTISNCQSGIVAKDFAGFHAVGNDIRDIKAGPVNYEGNGVGIYAGCYAPAEIVSNRFQRCFINILSTVEGTKLQGN